MGWTFLDINDLPDPGDIVWCKFPVREKPGAPGPTIRPTLVRANFIHEDDKAGIRFGSVVVSYGTGSFTEEQALEDLVISDSNAIKRCGLHKPTRFSLGRHNQKNLIWCSEYFFPQEYMLKNSIYIGKLGLDEEVQMYEKLVRRGILSP